MRDKGASAKDGQLEVAATKSNEKNRPKDRPLQNQL